MLGNASQASTCQALRPAQALKLQRQALKPTPIPPSTCQVTQAHQTKPSGRSRRAIATDALNSHLARTQKAGSLGPPTERISPCLISPAAQQGDELVRREGGQIAVTMGEDPLAQRHGPDRRS